MKKGWGVTKTFSFGSEDADEAPLPAFVGGEGRGERERDQPFITTLDSPLMVSDQCGTET